MGGNTAGGRAVPEWMAVDTITGALLLVQCVYMDGSVCSTPYTVALVASLM